jgi:CheY-like chemotaxis protein
MAKIIYDGIFSQSCERNSNSLSAYRKRDGRVPADSYSNCLLSRTTRKDYYLVQRGKIPAIQIGGRWRVKKSSLDRDILHQDKQGQPTVLVVDDDTGLQDLFRTFLKKIGFSRVVAGTAKEAVNSRRKQKFDLMFLDLQLPDAPGDQMYNTAKQIDPDLNVIVITGYPDSEILDRILEVSPVTVLKKPLKVEQLNQTAKILVHNGQSWRAEQQSSKPLVGL